MISIITDNKNIGLVTDMLKDKAECIVINPGNEYNINKLFNIGVKESVGDILIFIYKKPYIDIDLINEIVDTVSSNQATFVDYDNISNGNVFGLSKKFYDRIGGFDENYSNIKWSYIDLIFSLITNKVSVELLDNMTRISPTDDISGLMLNIDYFSQKWNLPRFPATEKVVKYLSYNQLLDMFNEYIQQAIQIIRCSIENELEVQKYLRSGKTLSNLSQRYNIQCNICTDLNIVALNYTNLSPMDIPLVKECRGLFLDLKTWNVVCKSMRAFFDCSNDQGKNLIKKIDWQSAKLTEKLDGALIVLYNYKNKWHIGMRMSADASLKTTAVNGAPSNLTFAELTIKTVKDMGYTWEEYTSKLNSNVYYSFELCAPETRFGVIYSDRRLVLIGAVDRTTLKDLDIYNLKWPLEKTPYYTVSSSEEIEKIVKEHNDPLIYEGFVLIDKNFNRVKYKNPYYIEMMSEPETNDELEALEQLLQYVASFSSLPPTTYTYSVAKSCTGPGNNAVGVVRNTNGTDVTGGISIYYPEWPASLIGSVDYPSASNDYKLNYTFAFTECPAGFGTCNATWTVTWIPSS